MIKLSDGTVALCLTDLIAVSGASRKWLTKQIHEGELKVVQTGHAFYTTVDEAKAFFLRADDNHRALKQPYEETIKKLDEYIEENS